MDELNDGQTLADVIAWSSATKVVLDKELAAPLSRLWCLYEVGSTPPAKLHLVTRGFSERDVSQHLRRVDAETALCFSPADKEMIHRHIVQRYDSLPRFTNELKLRLLLRPMSDEHDRRVLRERGAFCVFKYPIMSYKCMSKTAVKTLKRYPQISRRIRDTLCYASTQRSM